MDASVADIFIAVASVCIVLMTIMAGVVAFAVYRTAAEVRRLLRRMQRGASDAFDSLQFTGRWLTHFGRRLFSREE